MSYKTEQEKFWAGEFGDDYIERNQSQQNIASKLYLFGKALKRTSGISTALELGCNIGLNLKALSLLVPGIKMDAVEINEKAAKAASEIQGVGDIFNQSILDFEVNEKKWDFVFTAGVLIHIDPSSLNLVYEKLYKASSRYVFICEYYNPVPVEVNYRGHSERLFKRDFAGEIMDQYPDLKLVDYGFIWHRDPMFPADDGTWFLLEKSI